MDLFEVLAVISDWLFANAYKNMILLRSLCISCREASIYVESSVFLSGEHLIDQFLLYIQ